LELAEKSNKDTLIHLEAMSKPLADLEAMLNPTVRMPQALKKTLASTIEHVKKTEGRLRNWSITETEHLRKVAEKGGK